MARVHEINLNYDVFQQMLSDGYVVMETGTNALEDFILFRSVDDNGTELGPFCMTQIVGISTNDGFKDGYSLFRISIKN